MEDREFIIDPLERAKAYDATMDATAEKQDLDVSCSACLHACLRIEVQR